MAKEIKEVVKKIYTDAVTNNTGCCTTSCCAPTQDITFLKENYQNVTGYEAIADYGLGCGLPTEIASIKKGDVVLDLGSGAGNDAFIASKLVGDLGIVYGLDFTPAMLKQANENKEKLGIKNVTFIEGDIEQIPLSDNSVNVVISNCVMNLVPDKKKAFSEIYRVLEPKGHMSISDVVLSGELPKGILNAAELYAGCISGAMVMHDYLKIIENTGFTGLQVLKEHEIFLPDELLLQFINQNELEDFRKSGNKVMSITINATKAAIQNCCNQENTGDSSKCC